MKDRTHQHQSTIRMGIICLVAMLTTLALTPSCSKSAPESQNSDLDDSKADDGNSTVPTLKCASHDDTPLYYTLAGDEILPSAADVGLDAMYNLINQAKDSYVRLDICYNENTGNASLIRVIFRPTPISPDELFKVTSSSKVVGLDRAMIGDFKSLEIYVPEASNSTTGVLIQGKTFLDDNNKTQSLVIVVRVKKTSSTYEFQSLDLLAGKLQEGDPIGQQVCSAPSTEKDIAFVIDTAVFQAKLCTWQGAGETTEFSFVSVTVTDSNSALSEEQRKPLVFSGDAIQKALEPGSDSVKMIYMVNHHNACDSFYLRTPYAEYAATTAAMAGCGTAVQNAPARTMDDDRQNTLYRVNYQNADWQEGSIGCSHYVFDSERCNQLPVTDASTWTYHYTNHQWNAFDLSTKDYTVRIDTIAGDDQHPNANMSWGGRPWLVFNSYQVQTLATAEIVPYTTWPDPNKPQPGYIYCKRLAGYKDDPAAYPLTFEGLAAEFGISGVEAAATCPALNIPVPSNTRPGWDGTMGWTADMVCLLSPKTDTGRGPQFVGVYAPFVYVGSGQTYGKPADWPAETMRLCIDGTVYDLKEKVVP